MASSGLPEATAPLPRFRQSAVVVVIVAVPAVLAYNWLIRRNKSISEDLAAFTNDIHGYLMSNGAVKPAIASAAPKQAQVAKPAPTATTAR